MFVVIALFAIASHSVHATPLDDIKGLLGLFDFVGERSCLDDCGVSTLVIHLYDLFALEDSPTTFTELCKSYNQSSSCLSMRSGCVAEKETFRTMSSGLQYACNLERPVFELLIPCVEKSNAPLLSECERSCEFYDSLSHWTSGKRMAELAREGQSLLFAVEDAAEFCGSYSCYLLCAERALIDNCGKMGPKFLEIVTRPLLSLASLYRSSANMNLKEQVKSISLPTECATVVFDSASALLLYGKLDFSEGVLRNLTTLFGDSAAAKPEMPLDPFDQSLAGLSAADLAANDITEESSGSFFSSLFVVLAVVATAVGALIVLTLFCARSHGTAYVEPDYHGRSPRGWKLFGRGKGRDVEAVQQLQLTPERMNRTIAVPSRTPCQSRSSPQPRPTPSRAEKPFSHVE